MNLDQRFIAEGDEAHWHLLRSMTPEEKLKAANELWRIARDMTRQILSEQHPEWTPRRLQWEVAREMSHGEVEQVPPEHRPAGWDS